MVRPARSSQTFLCRKSVLCRRERETLAGLLRGDSEKEVAAALGLSPHTVHIYVKSLYAFFNVSSRGELTSFFHKSMIERLKQGVISVDDLNDAASRLRPDQVTVEGTDFWLRIVNVNFPVAPVHARTPRSRHRARSWRIPGFDAR